MTGETTLGRVSPLAAATISPRRLVPASIPRPEYVDKERPAPFIGSEVKDAETIEKMRVAGRLAAQARELVGAAVEPGITTDELDRIGHEFLCDHGAYPSTLGYRGFPKSLCSSVNEVICHGIPDSRRIEDGDIVNIDITAYLDGVHGDTNATYFAGNVDEESRLLVERTKEALDRGIKAVKPGRRINVIGRVIESYAARFGYGVVRDFTGHGIGTHFHSGLVIPHYDEAAYDTVIEVGMTFTIEPMLNLGTHEWVMWDDDWTVVTKDHRRSAQFEHTLLVTPERRGGPDQPVTGSRRTWSGQLVEGLLAGLGEQPLDTQHRELVLRVAAHRRGEPQVGQRLGEPGLPLEAAAQGVPHPVVGRAAPRPGRAARPRRAPAGRASGRTRRAAPAAPCCGARWRARRPAPPGPRAARVVPAGRERSGRRSADPGRGTPAAARAARGRRRPCRDQHPSRARDSTGSAGPALCWGRERAGRATAFLFGGPRKVRAPQGKVVGNAHPGQPAGQCHREQTASAAPRRCGGKGETVVQETTSGPGDRVGSANPTWSKVKKSLLRERCVHVRG